ncbi:hypothetical protein [Glycomyces salinus]|uniref:hypothetical protein n=1 Tax=Glycomyces salinus TaxID=980294 RepID=UPI0018ECD84B|nr:hypothetical protein [Glycomyces salinus]
MPDNGFEIDIDPVRDACVRIGSLRADFDEIHRYASEADPEPWMWGAPGLAFGLQYEVCAEYLRVLMAMLGSASEGIAARIVLACDDYEDADERAAKDIEGKANELLGGGGGGHELPGGDWSDGVG